MSACCTSGWLHNALPYHLLMPISGHFRECKESFGPILIHASSVQQVTRPSSSPFERFDLRPTLEVSSSLVTTPTHKCTPSADPRLLLLGVSPLFSHSLLSPFLLSSLLSWSPLPLPLKSSYTEFGESCNLPSGSRRSPAAKRILLHFQVQ